MTTLVRDGSKVAEFPVPFKGTWNGIPANMLASDALYDSLNVFIREGKLCTRPGLEQFTTTNFASCVIGGAMAVTPTEKILLAATPDSLFKLRKNQTEWISDSVLAIAENEQSIVDITFLETQGEYVGVIANGEGVIRKWTDSLGVQEITPTAGPLPIAKSVCTAARKIVALTDNHTLRWSSTFDYTNWNELAYDKVAQTNDAGVCVKRIGIVSFVFYKERSIYFGKAKAGSIANAFEVSFVEEVEGPAGIHAVVTNVDGSHMYMSTTGRIGLFNGSNKVSWIADGLWLFLEREIDQQYAYKIFGVYDFRLHCVVFYYPRIGDNGQLKGMVLINVPLQGSGVEAYSPFLGRSAIGMTFGYEKFFNRESSRSVLFSSNLGQKMPHIFDESYEMDGGQVFQCAIQTPIAPLPELSSHRINGEVFLERGSGYGTVKVHGVTSDILDNKSGHYEEIDGEVVSLEFADAAREYIGFNVNSRFFGLRLEWDSTANVKYAGSNIYGRVSAP